MPVIRPAHRPWPRSQSFRVQASNGLARASTRMRYRSALLLTERILFLRIPWVSLSRSLTRLAIFRPRMTVHTSEPSFLSTAARTMATYISQRRQQQRVLPRHSRWRTGRTKAMPAWVLQPVQVRVPSRPLLLCSRWGRQFWRHSGTNSRDNSHKVGNHDLPVLSGFSFCRDMVACDHLFNLSPINSSDADSSN